MKQSCGTLLYRKGDRGFEVLLVHPSGAYNRNAAWGLPKGVPDPGEDLETAARRETREETGIEPVTLFPLGSIVYTKSRKQVHGFGGEAPPGVEPRLASWEIDEARFLSVDEARLRIHPDQAAFLDRLLARLETAASANPKGPGRR